ncbi:MAG: sensor histidine kinase [Actinomycetota bacterium]|nr:sensor histidine kinase [Actinomycetota bacterium]
MVGNVLRALWAEPRPPGAPARVWRDWVLVGGLLAWSVFEVLLREDGTYFKYGPETDLVWRPVAVVVTVAVLLPLLWRRTHPFAAAMAAFGIFLAFDVARIFAGVEEGLLWSVAGILVLPYSLFRWGAGREAGIGLGAILVWLVVTHIAEPIDVGEMVAGYGFFLFSAALGASIRFHAKSRTRDIEQAKLRQRNQLARELHDTVGHHVSAIAIQAQAGRTLAVSDPERALRTLDTIEEAASRTLAEMRAMVSLLRDGVKADLAPQPSLADLEHLAREAVGPPRVDVQLSGELDDLNPAVEAALYRIAQESVTNAGRHARGATSIGIEVVGDAKEVHLIVRDDGHPVPAAQASSGYGLVGMAERATLLGGTLRAGPSSGRGWTVEAVLPKGGAKA